MPTPFQMRVYEATREIPRGCVVTYGELARYIGCRCARAVGQALRVNPYAPEVPCHRVVAADCSLGGFFGSRAEKELSRKRSLLVAEGVSFDGECVRRSCVWTFPTLETNGTIVQKRKKNG